MSEDKLTKDDLVLLMESYRNMITMHQTILAQSTKTIDKLEKIAVKQDSLFSKQGNICSTLSKINERIDDVNSEIKTSSTKMDNLASVTKEKINDHEKKSIDDHNKIVNKIYVGWVGMVSIIIALIGLGVTLAHLFPSNVTNP